MARVLHKRIEQLQVAVTDADSGAITNARKMEGLSSLEDCIPTLQRLDIVKEQPRVEEVIEKLLAQNATEPLRRLAVAVLCKLYKHGDCSALPTFVGKLLKICGEQSKKITNDTRVAALDVIGELIAQHGRALEAFSTDIFVVVAKHMKFPEANARCAAFSCLCKTVTASGLKSPSIAANIWKMIQKMLVDKIVTVRTAAAHALSAMTVASPPCASANGPDMASLCLKVLCAEDPPSLSSGLASECRFAFASALAQVLAAMATPMPPAPGAERQKKKPVVTDFASALEFLEQSAAKYATGGPAFVGCRASMCLAAVKLTEAMEIADSASLILVARTMLNIVDAPTLSRTKSGASSNEEELLMLLARHVGTSMRHLLLLADTEASLLEVIEQGLVPWVSAQFVESTRTPQADAQMVVVLETLCSACVSAGEGLGGNESQVKQPLLHLVGNHPSPLVQLHASFCMRVVARACPGQLFQLMSVLLNHVTVLNAEMLGAPTQRRAPAGGGGGAAGAVAAAAGSTEHHLQPLLRGLFGHCAALAALSAELFHSPLGVPHDVTSAVLGTSRALLQPHPSAHVSAQRRSCAFLLLEGLMCLGTDWVGQRLTTLFALWKAALGKKPVDRAKVLYQQHVAAPAQGEGGGESASAAACRDELLSLLFALRSLHAFTWHSRETLLTSLPHLHKILVVFLTNISQLVVALPHPTSANLRAKCRGEVSRSAVVTLSAHCGLPEILLMIRSTMYRTFSAMLPGQYSSRFVPLLNMLADDVTRGLPSDFPVAEFLARYMHTDDALLDLVDPFSEASKDASTTIRLVTAKLFPSAASGELPKDATSDATASSFFSHQPREGPGSIESLLAPWGAWLNPTQPLAEQSSSAEWDWRCSAVELLAIIMNAGDVSEQARSAVLAHLLKKREGAEEGGAQHGKKSSSGSGGSGASSAGDIGIVPTVAVLGYLREHVKVRGSSSVPPAEPMAQVLRLSSEGLKEANPVVRRLHIELIALLFFAHHQHSESPIVPKILQQISTEGGSDLTAMRSAIALLCGVILRTFAQASGAGRSQQAAAAQHCPYLMNIVPPLIKLGKETSQPVRLWMLYAIHLSLEATGPGFAPFLKDALRLATAHLLADFFESPLTLLVIAELVRSATVACLASEAMEADVRSESVSRIVGIWNELKHVRYMGPGNSAAFATMRTEEVCVSTASHIAALAPLTAKQHRDLLELVGTKLKPMASGGSISCAVRAAAARCLSEIYAAPSPVPGADLAAQDADVLQEPVQLFMLFEGASRAESHALQCLIRGLIVRRGLAQLPTWLQTLKEIVLALPPKISVAPPAGKAGGANPTKQSNSEDPGEQDAHDDGASMANPQAEQEVATEGYRAPRGATKVFAVRCAQLLLEQPKAEDTAHFQVEMLPGSPSGVGVGGGGGAAGGIGPRFVQHLDTIMGVAAHASTSDEVSLSAAGLALMRLIIERFKHTRDVHGQEDMGKCPLLLVQSEAQITACIRHNMRVEASPATTCLALELMRDVIMARACNSTQRLITMLSQPFTVPAFEPDPNFCEFASTRTFVTRLRCACEILDTETEDNSMAAHIKDLGRWIELALRDSAVLFAGLPLQSVKTYAPACFTLADYKVVQPCFQEALPTLLRGACALSSAASLSSSSSAPPGAGGGGSSSSAGAASLLPPDLPQLALGLSMLALGDQHSRPASSLKDARVYLRTVRQMLLLSSLAGGPSAAGGGGGAVGGETGSPISVRQLLDIFSRLWHAIVAAPPASASGAVSRLSPLLSDLLEIAHSVSHELFHGGAGGGGGGGGVRDKKKAKKEEAQAGADKGLDGENPPLEKASEMPWAIGLREDSPEATSARATVGAYIFHILGLALRDSAVIEDAARSAQAMEILVWWLVDSLQDGAAAGCIAGGGGAAAGAPAADAKAEASAAAIGEEAEDEAGERVEGEATAGAGADTGGDDEEDDELAAALEEGDSSPSAAHPAGRAAKKKKSRQWLWFLFESVFPLDVVQRYPAVTLKHWRSVCGALSGAFGLPLAESEERLRLLALISDRVSGRLLEALQAGGAGQPEEERHIVYLFALQVPAVTGMCAVLQHRPAAGAGALGGAGGSGSRLAVIKCLGNVTEVLSRGMRHQNAKVAQTTVTSVQNLLQGGAREALSAMLLPRLVAALVQQGPSALNAGCADAAWGVLGSMLAGQLAGGSPDVVEASTHLAVGMIASVAEYALVSPASYAGHASAMAQCLLQVARADQPGLKREIAGLSPEGQQVVQQILRDHVAAAAAASNAGPATGAGGAAAAAAPKIELKLRF